jgi:CRISPR-associated endonuclease Cas2
LSLRQRTFFLTSASDDRFIVCYDIADPKRLQNIAARIEKICMRIQRSVYYTEWNNIASLQKALSPAIDRIDPKSDDFRIYKISGKTYALHSAIDIDKPYIFI